MIIRSLGTSLDTIHITITRPKPVISYYGEESPEPTDKLFYGVLKILAEKTFEVDLVRKKFVNTGIEYVESNADNIVIQLRSTHLMKYGSSKINEIYNFLGKNGINPKARRNRKKDAKKETAPVEFYQNSRLDFAHDIETSFDLIKVLSDGIGHRRFFSGIQKDYTCSLRHENKRAGKGERVHVIKELKFGNSGFECVLYNKKLEIIEKASPDKFTLYPQDYRDIVSDKKRYLFRLELRFFRSRSIKFNSLTADELFNLAPKELENFGKGTALLKYKNGKPIISSLFSKLFGLDKKSEEA